MYIVSGFGTPMETTSGFPRLLSNSSFLTAADTWQFSFMDLQLWWLHRLKACIQGATSGSAWEGGSEGIWFLNCFAEAGQTMVAFFC